MELLMNKYTVTATVTCELAVDAATRGEAQRKVDDIFSRGDFVDFDIESIVVTEVPYASPIGAERWAAAAKSMRFAEDFDRRFLLRHGSWWWTNGHVALRCDGAVPEGWTPISDAGERTAEAMDPGVVERKAAAFGPETYVYDQRSTGTGYRVLGVPSLGINKIYRDLIESSVPGARWLAGPLYSHALHVIDADGALVAVVAGMRADDEEFQIPVASATVG